MKINTRPRLTIQRLALTVACGSVVLNIHAVAGDNPHETGDVPGQCEVCHAVKPEKSLPMHPNPPAPDMAKFRLDGVGMCEQCHDPAEAGHPLGEPLDFSVPPDLPLAEDGSMTCLTCHYVHGKLQSERLWASVSFMDRIFDKERIHKTYLLRRNNANGELCMVCHDPEKARQ